MKTIIKISVIILFFLLPASAHAIEQERTDFMRLLLIQSSFDEWDAGWFTEQDLEDGLTLLFNEAELENNEDARNNVIWAMGQTGLEVFVPILTGVIDEEPFHASVALSNIPSEDGVAAMIGYLDYSDPIERAEVVYYLGDFKFYSNFQDARDDALVALSDRLAVESEGWIIEKIHDAIIKILETQ